MRASSAERAENGALPQVRHSSSRRRQFVCAAGCDRSPSLCLPHSCTPTHAQTSLMPSAADGRPAHRRRAARPPLETVAPHAATAADTRFARALASPDPSTRARALDALGAWLGARAPGGVPRGDMLKLWAGVFYAFWHSDLGPVQVRVCGRVVNLWRGGRVGEVGREGGGVGAAASILSLNSPFPFFHSATWPKASPASSARSTSR